MELIDRDKLKEAIKMAITVPVDCSYDLGYNDMALNAVKIADSMPTVDANPIIYAHWIMLDKQVGQCSNCGYCQKSNGIDKTGHGNIHKAVYKWCAVCGAKMDGGDAK